MELRAEEQGDKLRKTFYKIITKGANRTGWKGGEETLCLRVVICI